jgi:hypothetical protein
LLQAAAQQWQILWFASLNGLYHFVAAVWRVNSAETYCFYSSGEQCLAAHRRAVGFIDWLDGSFRTHQAMGAVGVSAEALAGERFSGLV